MKKLLAGLLLAPSLLLARPVPTPLVPVPVVASFHRVPAAPADLPEAVTQAYYYLVGLVGIEPCDALKTALGYDSVTAPQRYAHERLQAIGYDFPTPDPEEAFDCPL